MTKLLAKALDSNQTSTDRFIGRLEELSGYPGEDIRLSTEVANLCAQKITSLGLDPNDTSAEELYHSLQAKYVQTSNSFASSLGGLDDMTLADKYKRLERVLSSGNFEKVWALKPSSIKVLLKKNSPRQTMKKLGYRSVDSLLKREDPNNLLAIAWQLESSHWQALTSRAISKLSPSDIVLQTARVVLADPRLWNNTKTRRPLVAPRPQAGRVMIWPNSVASDISSLGVVALSHSALDELYDWSAGAHWLRLDKNFARSIVKHWQSRRPKALKLASRPIYWSSLRNHISTSGDTRNPSDEFDQLMPEVESIDYQSMHIGRWEKSHPQLNWWADCAPLLFVDSRGQTVSLNISDVAINNFRKLTYADQTASNGSQRLEDELVGRYMGHQAVANYIWGNLASSHRPSLRDPQPVKPNLGTDLRLGPQVGISI